MAGKLDHVLDLILEGNQASWYSHGLLFGQLIEGYGRVQQTEVLDLLKKRASSGAQIPEMFIRFTSPVSTRNTDVEVERNPDDPLFDDPNVDLLSTKKRVPRPGKVSNIAKLGMNVFQGNEFKTPQGIYAYGVTDKFYDKYFGEGHRTFADTLSFLNVFSVKSSYKSKCLDIGNYSESDLTRDLDELKKFYPKYLSAGKSLLIIKPLKELKERLDDYFDLVKMGDADKAARASFVSDADHIMNPDLIKEAVRELFAMEHVEHTRSFAERVRNGFADLLAELRSLKKMATSSKSRLGISDVTTVSDFVDSVDRLLSQVTEFTGNSSFSPWVQVAIQSAGKTENQKKYPATRLWNVTRELSHRLHGDSELAPGSRASIVRWTSILRKLGYEWVYDFGIGLIHRNEPQQAVFFHGGMFDVIWQGTNPKKQNYPDTTSKDFEDRVNSNRQLSNAKKFFEFLAA